MQPSPVTMMEPAHPVMGPTTPPENAGVSALQGSKLTASSPSLTRFAEWVRSR